MGSRRDGSRASRSRSIDRTRSERSHRDDRDRDRESSRSHRRSRSADRSSKRSSRHSASRSTSSGCSPPRDAPASRKDDNRDRRTDRRDSRAHSSTRNRETTKRRRRERSSSVSSSSSSDESSSSSDSDSSRRRHRKKESKRKKKSSKKDKKKKKKHSSSHGAVNQNAYGKYGILKESDFHTKSQSFQTWLRDIKKITEFNGPKWEAMEMFKEYMEDYNTATLPHEKYYDIEKYEMKEYQKQQRKRAKEIGKHALVVDEDALRRERHAQKVAREQADFQLVLQTMDTEKIEAMRRQEQLRAQMQMHYKAGDVSEARRLEQLLRVDEDASRKR